MEDGVPKPPEHVVVTREGDRVRVELPERMLGTGLLMALLFGGPVMGCVGVPLLLALGVGRELALGLALVPFVVAPFVGMLRPAVKRRVVWTPRALLAEERLLGVRLSRRVVPLDAVLSTKHTETLAGSSVVACLEGYRLVEVHSRLDAIAARWLRELVASAATHRQRQLEGKEVSAGPPRELLALVERRLVERRGE